MLAFYPTVTSPWHAWSNIVDMGGKRYLYAHDRDYMRVLDITDPANPTVVSQLSVPGQDIDNPEDLAAYLDNPRAGNRTSWMGLRNPLALPISIEDGGKIGFGGMGGLGFWTFDVSDPANPVVAATFPRPTPPTDASFIDYCQRRGSFGPKRSGGIDQPGRGRDGVLVYAFYNAGIQIFDVEDPINPTIAGDYVPSFPSPEEVPDWTNDNAVFAVFVEYDRNIIWAFAVNGVYALTTPLLGEPMTDLPNMP